VKLFTLWSYRSSDLRPPAFKKNRPPGTRAVSQAPF
jgi:hypothetical protein